MKRSGMPARSGQFGRGKPEDNRTQLRRTRLTRKTPLSSRPAAPAGLALARVEKRPRPRKDTGFSPAVKLAIRTRAGNGDPDQARCEATGVFLGRYGGEVQHRVARLSGGRGAKAPWWFHTPANGALLSREAHRLAEARDEHMHAQGFWLTSTQDASAEPVMLHDSSGGGITVWLTADGQYGAEPPAGAA